MWTVLIFTGSDPEFSGAPALMRSLGSCWRRPMSTRLSLREVLERRVVTPASVLAGSASRTIKLLLTAEAFDRPVDVARLLWRHGLSLKRAHMALDRLAERKLVPVELVTDNPDSTIAE